jgi:hypothetical protein
MSEPYDACCLPGDITITEVLSGWMLSRALEQIGPGPWWAYITIIPDFETAVQEARALAREAGVRAWRRLGGEQYEPIDLEIRGGGAASSDGSR